MVSVWLRAVDTEANRLKLSSSGLSRYGYSLGQAEKHK